MSHYTTANVAATTNVELFTSDLDLTREALLALYHQLVGAGDHTAALAIHRSMLAVERAQQAERSPAGNRLTNVPPMTVNTGNRRG